MKNHCFSRFLAVLWSKDRRGLECEAGLLEVYPTGGGRSTGRFVFALRKPVGKSEILEVSALSAVSPVNFSGVLWENPCEKRENPRFFLVCPEIVLRDVGRAKHFLFQRHYQ